MTSRVRFITLGCKVNQYETQSMRESLERVGIASASASPGHSIDFVIINTCTVTKSADHENLYWIRRARREHPQAKIVVTGCFVERNRREIEALPDVDLIVSNHEKSEIAGLITEGCARPEKQDELNRRSQKLRYTPLSISRTQGNGRAFLKIQDGCNHACSFCKVVMVRGRSRSRQLPEIVDEAVRLRDAGYKEIVFTGIQLGAYGMDLSPASGLVDLLEACEKIEGIERLRLSSIEPTDVTPSLIDALRSMPKCCPHLHIPLQSGDDRILSLMNRRYRGAFYRDLIARLKSEMPDFSLTLDVMAGFPGEEEPHFQNTLDLLAAVQPLKSHVFPYSKREGTRAARFRDLDEAMIRSRVSQLIRATDGLAREIRLSYIGREFPVLIEKNIGKGTLVQGLTSNYLKVCFEGNKDLIGSMVLVKLLALEGDTFLGKSQNVPVT